MTARQFVSRFKDAGNHLGDLAQDIKRDRNFPWGQGREIQKQYIECNMQFFPQIVTEFKAILDDKADENTKIWNFDCQGDRDLEN